MAALLPGGQPDGVVEARVAHPVHGEGVVESWRRGGRVAVVRFDGGALPVEVPARELTVVGGGGGAAGVDEAPAEALRGTLERDLAAMTLEAMRLGVVPAADLTAYTVGRDAELALVDEDLARAGAGAGAVRVFLGDYGTGKTHLLELAQQRALQQGFLTSLVMLDPEETSPAHPKRVYRAVVRNLRYPDRPFEEGAGLEPLLERAVASAEARAAFGLEPPLRGAARELLDDPRFHLYLTPALAAFQAIAGADPARTRVRGVAPDRVEHHLALARDLLLDWLEGHPTLSNQTIDRELSRLPGRLPKVYSLLDYRPWARIYGYLLSGLATLARRAGYRGLAVLLDEAEFYALLSSDNRGYARGLFKAWSVAAAGGEAADDAPADDAAWVEDDGAGVGGYGVQREVPARHPAGEGLYVAFAMTPNPDGEDVLREAVPEALHRPLAPLGREDYLRLSERVCDFYASAWPSWTVPRAVVPALGKVLAELLGGGFVDNPRQAMKFVIDFLDIARSSPDKVASVVRHLQSTVLF